ncbi:MAG: cob(I)yrinic acid a,c-diamide adenosyltransferase [Flavobacteriales bacterium]|jgi:cob(I)alamin adenosyltransferase
MKIYTKRGDEGTTSLLGGARVPKHHLRIEAYGTVDELNSYMGLLRDLAPDEDKVLILRIQDRLFTMGSHLALEPDHAGKMKLPSLSESDVEQLEVAMDAMDEVLPEMRNFVLPGGHPAVSHCHIARCVCRRAERLVTHLGEHEVLPPLVLAYLNRLSDYLFVLSRRWTQVFSADEKPWIPES